MAAEPRTPLTQAQQLLDRAGGDLGEALSYAAFRYLLVAAIRGTWPATLDTSEAARRSGADAADATAAWLAARMVARQQRERPRCWGVSSDALALYGAGYGPRPEIPGAPAEATPNSGRWTPQEAGRSYPLDVDDLNACERTVAMAPEGPRRRMAPVLEQFRSYVLDGRDRHGNPAHLQHARGRAGWEPHETTAAPAPASADTRRTSR